MFKKENRRQVYIEPGESSQGYKVDHSSNLNTNNSTTPKTKNEPKKLIFLSDFMKDINNMRIYNENFQCALNQEKNSYMGTYISEMDKGKKVPHRFNPNLLRYNTDGPNNHEDNSVLETNNNTCINHNNDKSSKFNTNKKGFKDYGHGIQSNCFQVLPAISAINKSLENSSRQGYKHRKYMVEIDCENYGQDFCYSNKSEVFDKTIPKNNFCQVRKTIDKVHIANQEWILSAENPSDLINKQNELMLISKKNHFSKNTSPKKDKGFEPHYSMSGLMATSSRNEAITQQSQEEKSPYHASKFSENPQTRESTISPMDYFMENGIGGNFHIQRNLEYTNRYRDVVRLQNGEDASYGASVYKKACRHSNKDDLYLKERTDSIRSNKSKCKASPISPCEEKITGNNNTSPKFCPFNFSQENTVVKDLRGN